MPHTGQRCSSIVTRTGSWSNDVASILLKGISDRLGDDRGGPGPLDPSLLAALLDPPSPALVTPGAWTRADDDDDPGRFADGAP